MSFHDLHTITLILLAVGVLFYWPLSRQRKKFRENRAKEQRRPEKYHITS
jgi:hypothetical protein